GRAAGRAREHVRDPPGDVRRGGDRGGRRPAAASRGGARGRDRRLRGRVPALLRARARGDHGRAGRAARLIPPLSAYTGSAGLMRRRNLLHTCPTRRTTEGEGRWITCWIWRSWAPLMSRWPGARGRTWGS